MKSGFSKAIDAARAELRSALPSGHAGNGGLRIHSLSALYPFCVVPFDPAEGGRAYQVWNLIDEGCISTFPTYREAEEYAAGLRAKLVSTGSTPREQAWEAAERGEW